MLTPKQFEAIGRATLAFNHIESAFEMYMAVLLTPEEIRVSWPIVQDGTFQNKAKRFRGLLEGIADEYPALEVFTRPLMEVIAKAKKMAEERNGYVHALIDHDFTNNQTFLRVRGERVEPDCDAILNLAARMTDLIRQLNKDGDALLFQLQKARTEPRGPAGLPIS